MSGPRPTAPSGPPSPSNAIRARLNSMAPRALDTSPSPLAQVFQPLVVTDTIPEEPLEPTQPIGLGYAPGRRRRLSSIQSTKRSEDSLFNQAQPHAMTKFPLVAKTSSGASVPLSKSPNQLSGGGSPTSATVETQTPDMAVQDYSAGILDWTRRMDEMERRQGRIEELLVQIAHDIKGANR
jgi:hypothetical protein